MPPEIIKKMLATPGIYLVTAPGMGGYAPIVVLSNGTVQQLKVDGLLSPDGWSPAVEVRGPLLDTSPRLTIEEESDDVIRPATKIH